MDDFPGPGRGRGMKLDHVLGPPCVPPPCMQASMQNTVLSTRIKGILKLRARPPVLVVNAARRGRHAASAKKTVGSLHIMYFPLLYTTRYLTCSDAFLPHLDCRTVHCERSREAFRGAGSRRRCSHQAPDAVRHPHGHPAAQQHAQRPDEHVGAAQR